MSDMTVLALDVGDKRIGVSVANTVTRLPRPLTTVIVDGSELDQIKQLVSDNQADTLVVGLPRGLDGQETAQTAKIREFAGKLDSLGLKVALQDEAVTSRQAEDELKARGKKYRKEDIDALAATYLAEDYLRENKQ